jgi:hypothetical protein
MLKMVSLSKIKDNPYRDKKRNPIDKDRVEHLTESIETTGFWKGIYGREVEDSVEIAFGHTRVDAARAAGLVEIPVEIEKFSDSDMLMRMTRENLRGELLVSLEAVSAAVKALAEGAVKVEEADPKTNTTALRYAPSFVPGKPCSTPGVSHAYTADSLARVLGGVYLRPNGKAQPGVLAALGILEMEERKVLGFSERVLREPDTEEGVHYLGAKKIIKIVSEVKEKEVKIAERQVEIKKANAADAAKMRELQAQVKAREVAAEAARKVELDKLKAAREAEDKAESDRLFLRMKAQRDAQIAKALADKGKMEELETRVEERKRKEEVARNEDAYTPIRRDVERAMFKMENVATGSFCEDVKSLAKRTLSLKDRQRLWEAASALADWYGGWVCAQFVVAPDQLRPRLGKKARNK